MVKERDAPCLNIDVTTTREDVVLQGFVNNRRNEDRVAEKIRQNRGVKSVMSLLKMEEEK